MKKTYLGFALISALIFICNSVSAVYTDVPNNLALLHCDTVVTSSWPAPNTNSYWLLTPDDNSSGREACTPVLNMTNNFSSFTEMDPSTIPTFKPGSPYGGDYMHFNGLTDSVYVAGGWLGDSSIGLDVHFRWLGLPPLDGDNFAGIVWALPWKCYFRNNDNTNGYIQMLLYTGASTWFPSTQGELKLLTSNVWYDLHFELYTNVMTLIIGNAAEGYKTNQAVLAGDIDTTATQVIIGSDNFLPSRLFNGDMDEIRWGYEIPEPGIILMMSLMVISALRRFTTVQ